MEPYSRSSSGVPGIFRSIFTGLREPSTIYYVTLGLCTAVSTVNAALDVQVDMARAGGNRFGIANALRDQQRMHEVCTASRSNIRQGRYYTLVTAIFNHASIPHFIGNIFALMSVGKHLRPMPFFTLFYGGAVLGNILCLVIEARLAKIKSRSWLRRPNGTSGWYLGASGGVAAIMAMLSCVWPKTPLTMSVGPLRLTLPAWLHTIAYALYSVWAQMSDHQNDVAHMGHLGGLVWGLMWYMYQFRRLPWL